MSAPALLHARLVLVVELVRTRRALSAVGAGDDGHAMRVCTRIAPPLQGAASAVRWWWWVVVVGRWLMLTCSVAARGRKL